MSTVIETQERQAGASIQLALASLVFVGSLAGTLVFDVSRWGDEESRTVFELPDDMGGAEFLDGKLARAVEDQLLETSMARRWATVVWSRALFSGLGHLATDVIEGTPGWLFLESRLQRHPGMRPEQMRQFAAIARQMVNRFAERGCELSILLLPRKGLVAGERLGHHQLHGGGGYWQLIEAFKTQGVRAPSLAEAFLSRPPEQTWFRLDTHFNLEGAGVAARAFTDGLGILKPLAEREVRVRPSKAPMLEATGLVQTGGMIDETVDLPYPGLEPVDQVPFFFKIIEGQPRHFRPFEQRNAKDAQQWLVGTSFSNVFGVLPLFLESFTGSPLRNMAVDAGGPFTSLGRAIRDAKQRDAWPERCFWELPAFNLLSTFKNAQRPTRGLIALLRWLPRKDSHALASLGTEPARGLPPLHPYERGHRHGALAEGRNFVSDGSGNLHFRLRRKASGPALKVHLVGPGLEGTIPWTAADPLLDIPLCAGHPTAYHRVEAQCSKAQFLALVEEIEICAERPLPADDRWQSLPAASRTHALPQHCEVSLGAPAPLAAGSTLFLRRKPEIPGHRFRPAAKILRITAFDDDQRSVTLWKSEGKALEPGVLTVISAAAAAENPPSRLRFVLAADGSDLSQFEFALAP